MNEFELKCCKQIILYNVKTRCLSQPMSQPDIIEAFTASLLLFVIESESTEAQAMARDVQEMSLVQVNFGGIREVSAFSGARRAAAIDPMAVRWPS